MLILFCFNLGLGDIVVTSSEDVDLAVFGLPFVGVCGFAFLSNLALRFTFFGDFFCARLVFSLMPFFFSRHNDSGLPFFLLRNDLFSHHFLINLFSAFYSNGMLPYCSEIVGKCCGNQSHETT